MKNRVIIRMGALHNDVAIQAPNGVRYFNLNELTKRKLSRLSRDVSMMCDINEPTEATAN